MITIEEFCDNHSACREVREWALENCVDMPDAWHKLQPDWLIWVATSQGVLTDRELRLFAVFCARQVQHLLTDQRSRNAIDIAEKFANGDATKKELVIARAAARSAAADAHADWSAAAAAAGPADAAADAAAAAAAWAAAWAADAAAHAAWSADADAASSAASRNAIDIAEKFANGDATKKELVIARAAARSAAAAAHAAWSADADAASSAARSAQADWLRKNTSPNF